MRGAQVLPGLPFSKKEWPEETRRAIPSQREAFGLAAQTR
jgi:hypothetical protein